MNPLNQKQHPPAGLFRLLYRLPIWMYRLGLGGMLGRRFLLLEHTGRRSGQKRHVVLEVAAYERNARAPDPPRQADEPDPPKSGSTYYIVSGWGKRSQWFRNLLAHPDVRITVAGRRFTARAEVLPHDEGLRVLREYREKHRWAAWFTRTQFGYATYEEMFAAMPVVALRVREPRNQTSSRSSWGIEG